MLPSTTGIHQPNLGHIVPTGQTMAALTMHIRPGNSAHQSGGGLVTVEVSGTGMLAAGDDQGFPKNAATVSESACARGFCVDHITTFGQNQIYVYLISVLESTISCSAEPEITIYTSGCCVFC